MKQVGALTFHTYGENSVGPQVERVAHSGYPWIPVWLTEYGDLNDRDKTFENEWKNYSLASNRRALVALNQGASAVFFFDAFDDYEECARRLTFYGLFRSASHVYAPKKRYYATRQLYHFVPPGARRIGASSDAHGTTLSAFLDGDAGSLIVVGVKEGGPEIVDLSVDSKAGHVDSWDVYETTPSLNCAKTATVETVNGTAGIEIPGEAVFTLVGKLNK
jgi:hypothetical protein